VQRSNLLDPRSASPAVDLRTSLRYAIRRLAAFIPSGGSLPAESWRRRHRGIVLLLWAHVLAVPWMGIATGNSLGHSLAEASILVPFTVGASLSGFTKRSREVLATFGLMSCSAIFTHLSGGLIEMHFHFFVMVALVTLYQSWLPFGVAIVYVVVHHGLFGALDPTSVFNHPAGIANPWKWALVHGLFISAESVVCLIAWRLNEIAIGGERAARLELLRANEDLAEAQSLARVGSYDWDTATGDMEWSDELYRILGVDPSKYDPTHNDFNELIHPDDRYKIQPAVDEAFRTRAPFEMEVRIVRPNGEVRLVHGMGSVPADDDGTSTRLVGTVQDITDRRRLEDEIRYQAFHDALTGLANRALLLERLNHALMRRERTPMALLFLDLDEFKGVNDALGHAAGDDLLVGFARRLESLIRPSDTPARFGGDEFAILLEDTDEPSAIAVAERILTSLRTSFRVVDQEVLMQASIGIATMDEGSTSDLLLRDADIAMYAAKTEGKSRYRLGTPELRAAASDNLALRRELGRAVERGELVLRYQPIVDLRTERIVGLEALVRWNHPTRGMVSPLEFIPLAEETGQIVELGTWVLREATKRVRDLHDELGVTPWISVNLSTRQLEQDDLVDVVAAAIGDSGLAAEHLVLEITETAMMSNAADGTRRVQELRALGVRIAIDDFGTGYSSLGYLHTFPVDILKIDRTFISAATGGTEGSAVAKAIVQLGSTLRLQTIAEGIEQTELQDSLLGMGCEIGQGFLFSPPLELSLVRERLMADGSNGLRVVSSA
jgi:diguanylate cyclase (GGDEF)-like protein/PAS domain S-box-containing protein